MTVQPSPLRRPRAVAAPTVLGPVGRIIGATCLVLGPVCFAIAETLTPEGSGDFGQILTVYAAEPGRIAASITLSLLSAAFFLGGLFALLARPLTRGRVITPIGLGLTIWTMLANTLLLGVNVMFLAMSSPGLNREAMIAAMNALTNSPVAPLALSGHYLLVVAFLLLGIGFWRAGIGPRWAAALIALCGVVDAGENLLGALGHILLGIVISDGMMIAGFAAVAWFLGRERVRTASPATQLPSVDQSESSVSA